MQRFPDDETPAADATEPTVMVSVFDDHVVVRAPALLDLEMTEVLVVAAASAVAAGLSVMIDLDPDTASDQLVARRPLSAATAGCFIGEGRPVEILGAGYVRLGTRDANWTIDLAQGRLCRSDDAIEPHFVAPDGWTSVHALWVTQTTVTALTEDGTYLSTRSAWTTPHQTTRLARA